MNKPKVLLSLPHMGSSSFASGAAVDGLMLPDERVQLHVIRPSAVPVENNLNQVIKKFLEGDWDFWINLDHDQSPLKNPIDLVFLDKDIIGLPTPAYKPAKEEGKSPFYWAVYSWNEDRQAHQPYKFQPQAGPIQEVDAVGAGCWVVARRVLEAIKQPMLRRYDEQGVVTMGCDLSFCSKARAAGFKVYAHYEYPCRHFKTVDLYEVIRLLASREQGQNS